MNRELWGVLAFMMSAIALVALVFALQGLSRGAHARTLNAGGEVEGSILSIEERRHMMSPTDAVVLYQYEVEGKRYQGESIFTVEKAGALGFSSPVRVLYMRGKPSVSRLQGDRQDASGYTQFLISALFLVGFGGGAWYFWRALFYTRPRW